MSIKYLKKYKCDECGKNFTHNIGLKRHITDDHERKDSIVICDQCGKNFTRGCDLKVCIQIKLFMRKTLNLFFIFGF